MFSAKVIRGDGIGKALLCPTANLDISPKKTQLREGIYAGYGHLDRVTYKAAISIKYSSERVEVHLLDYDGDDFYGKTISVEAVQQIGQMEKLDTVMELRDKIQQDLKIIRDMLEEEEKEKT